MLSVIKFKRSIKKQQKHERNIISICISLTTVSTGWNLAIVPFCAVYSMAGFQPWTKDAPQTIKRNKNRTTTMKAHTTSFYMMNIIKLYTKQLRHQWDEFLLIDCIFFIYSSHFYEWRYKILQHFCSKQIPREIPSILNSTQLSGRQSF